MVLVHDDGNMRELLDGRLNQVLEEIGAGILARAGGRLQDHRTVHFIGAFHDGTHLLKIVYVEGRNAVVVLSGVVQKLS